MKLTLNIEKKHLYILTAFIILIGVGVVIATGWNGQQSHPTLFADIITGRSGSTVTVNDDLIIQNSKGITLGGVRRASWPAAGTSLNVYKGDGVTLLGSFVQYTSTNTCSNWVYTDTSTGALVSLTAMDCATFTQTDIYHEDDSCLTNIGAYSASQGYVKHRVQGSTDSFYQVAISPTNVFYNSITPYGGNCVFSGPGSRSLYQITGSLFPRCGGTPCVLRVG